MKQVHIILLTILAIISAVSIPLFFINQESIISFLMKVYPLEVDKRYTGGEVSVVYHDPYGDDNGDGNLKYPAHEAWNTPGTLDLLRYVINEPVTDGKWTSERVFQQIDLSFAGFSNPLEAPLGFSNPIIHIYIDIDGKSGGSVETMDSRAELVGFNPDYPWDFLLSIHGFSKTAEISAYDGSYSARVQVYTNAEDNTISVRLPLEKEGLLPILDGRTTRHYVLIGAYSQLARGNFMTVKGKYVTRMSPRIFDYLAPVNTAQNDLLSSFNSSTNTYALLSPVSIDPATDKTNQISEAALQELKRKADAEGADTIKPTVEEIFKTEISNEQLVIALFKSNYIDEAEKVSLQILEKNPNNGIILAYYGSITAIRGGEASSVIESVNLVQKAYELFSQAQTFIKTDEELIHLYLNRGNVSMSIPETVFLKSLEGAEDFTKAADILIKSGTDSSDGVAAALINAGKCYERGGKPVMAELVFFRASGLTNLNDSARYELALRGF